MKHTLPYFLFLAISHITPTLPQIETETNCYIVAIIDADARIGKEQKTGIEMAIIDFNNHSLASNLSLTVQNSGGDPFTAASIVEELIKEQQVTVIIGPSTWQETALVSDIGTQAQVPVLSFATVTVTTPVISLRWPYLIRMAENDLVQMRCIAAIVEFYEWHRVIALYGDNGYVGGDSNAVTLLSDALRSVGSEIETRYAFPSLSSLSHDPKTVIRDKLEELKSEQCKVFVMVEMPLPLAVVIFEEAKELEMMEKGYVWITTNGVTSLLDSVNSSVISSMEGVLGIKTYFDESNMSYRQFRNRFLQNFQLEYLEEAHEPSIFALRAYDAVSVVFRNLETNPIQGETLVSTILSSRLKGLSGEIGFRGGELDRVPVFQIINIIGKRYREVGFWSPESSFSEKINGPYKGLGSVYWPGGPSSVPKGWSTPTVVKPMKIGVPGKTFAEFVSVTHDPIRNVTAITGFCVDVFEEALKLLPYDLPHEFEVFNGTYDDMVQQVYLKSYDAVVGDTTIIANRSRYVEFSQPYLESGLSMLVLTVSKDSRKAWMFLKPFTKSLWWVTLAIFLYTGIVVWLLEHRQNPDFRGPWVSQIGTLLWFTFSTLFFAHRERVQSNYTRMVIVVWLVVVFVLVSSYTASLTSMLTVQRLEPKVTDIEWLRRTGAKVGCDGNSFVLKYLLDVLHFKPNNIKYINSADEYLAELRSGDIAAAFLESPYAKVLLARHCKGYTTTGPSYRLGGLGFVFPLGSPIVHDISKAILTLSENGKLQDLEEELYSSFSRCASTSTNIDDSGSLSLRDFWGLFAITGGTSTVILVLFITRLLQKFRRYCKESKGNGSPMDKSVWKCTLILARFFDQGKLHPLPKASTPSSDDWSSIEYVSENNSLEDPQSSPMPTEGPRDIA